MSGVQFLAALGKLPPGITVGEVADIAALVVEWAKARQLCMGTVGKGVAAQTMAEFRVAYADRKRLERLMAASVGLPATWADGPAPDAPGAAHEP